MKIIAYSLIRGGAAISANKFFKISASFKGESFVTCISQDNSSKIHFFKRLISYLLVKLQYDNNPIKHSLNLFSYLPVIKSFQSQPEAIYHLHWINNDTLSIFDLHRIPSGSILTLHDEWLYCGAEHCYKVDDHSCDFKNGYVFLKKGIYGIHWNYIIWRIKKNKLIHRKDLIYTVPSTWMLERAKSSVILKDSDVRYLPNPIDTDIFRPSCVDNELTLRNKYAFLNDDLVFCFGAIGGKKNTLKGAKILENALKILSEIVTDKTLEKIKLIDFGGAEVENEIYGFRSVSVGQIKDLNELALLYSAVDCVVVPSMVESFGQVAAEALSCSTPVLCFDTSGLRDIIEHEKTGLIAAPFSAQSLADCMLTLVNMPLARRKAMGELGRDHVLRHFSYSSVSEQYFKILKDAENIKKKYD